MRKNNIIGAVIMAVLLGCLTFGIWHLFALRFEAGDVYPVYSSLRSDPLGVRVFYESLKKIDTVAVRRNYRRLAAKNFEPQTTFFYFGAPVPAKNAMDREVVELADALMRSGGRMVISFLPVNKKKAALSCVKKPVPAGNEKQQSKPLPAPEKQQHNTMVSLPAHWQIGLDFDNPLPAEKGKPLPLTAVTLRTGLPSEISWHTNLFFKPAVAGWRVIYSCRNKPVLVERKFGKGSLVLSADSFFISNEALWSQRHPQLLAWLVGSNAAIIFDETHLGLVRQPSVARLLRDYRLHWFLLALAVLALLFVWKNAVYFVPPRREFAGSPMGVATEKDYTQALIALLRRNIPGSRLLDICRQQWEMTIKKHPPVRDDVLRPLARINAQPSSSTHPKPDPVQEYRRICKIIAKDKTI